MAHSSIQGPAYYKRGKIEVWDFIRDQQLNYHLGCAIKYITRAGHKEDKVADLKKAIHYLKNEIENTLYSDEPSPGIPPSIQHEPQLEPEVAWYAKDFDR